MADYKIPFIQSPIRYLMVLTFFGCFASRVDGSETGPNKIAPAEVKYYAKFRELPITAVTPEGWLGQFLRNQRDGLTGHLEVTGWPFDTCGWTEGDPGLGPHENECFRWGAYEHNGYWGDAMIRCGYLLRDDFLIQKAKKQIDYVLTHPAANGYLGPQTMTELWPRAVFFRSLMADFSATGDRRILEALEKHYLTATTAELHGSGERNNCNVEEICWLYGMTGNPQLLDYALKAYLLSDPSPQNLLSDRKSEDHGASYTERVKLPAILYMYNGDEMLLKASINGFRKIDRDHMLIDGIPSSDEHFAGKNPKIYHESCVISDYTWSAGYVLLASGQAEWADKIERACFNAGMGAITKDFKAHQYFSSPNQVIVTNNSSSNWGTSRMAYRPAHECECCTANITRFMPNYVFRMWLGDGDGGLVAALYGPCSVQAKVGKEAQAVTIVESTDYPFSETIEFKIQTPQKVRFPLWVRIPGWSEKAAVLINGRRINQNVQPGSFLKLDREFSDGDRVTLSLPMSLKLSRWPQGGVGIERGPLVYSLRIEEDRQVDKDAPKSTEEFPSWNILPSSSWNYAMAIDEKKLDKDVEIIHSPTMPNPWQIDDAPAPIQLRVPVRRVKKWTLHGENVIPIAYDKAGSEKIFVLQTPDLPDPATLTDRLDDKVETITLVPYGCTRLRLTIFPSCRRK